jgi:hypothetical protein
VEARRESALGGNKLGTRKQARSKKSLRAVKTTRAPLSSESSVPACELGKEVLAGSIKRIDGDMGPGLKVALIRFERGRGDKTLEQMKEGSKAEEPDTSHAFPCSLPQGVDGVALE